MATPVDEVKVVYYNSIQPFPIMSTEDDTFKALRRIPFQEMRLIIRRAKKEKQSYAKLKKLLESNGWTRLKYQETLANELHGL